MVLRAQGTLGEDPETLSLRRAKRLPGQEAGRNLCGWRRGKGGRTFQVRRESGKRNGSMVFESGTSKTLAAESSYKSVLRTREF